MLESLFNKVTDLKDTYFEEHLWTTASICNKLLEKIRAVFHIQIEFDLNVKKTSWKKIQFQLALNKTFCSTPPPLIHWRFKHCQKTKINKTILSASPSSVFHTQSSQYQYLKASKYSILTVMELAPPVSEFSTGSQHFMPPLILNTNLIKQESKIGYPWDSISHSLPQHYDPPLMGRVLRFYTLIHEVLE